MKRFDEKGIMKKTLFIYLFILIIFGGRNNILFAQQAGIQKLKLGPINREASVPVMDQTSFFLSGKKMYEIGQHETTLNFQYNRK